MMMEGRGEEGKMKKGDEGEDVDRKKREEKMSKKMKRKKKII